MHAYAYMHARIHMPSFLPHVQPALHPYVAYEEAVGSGALNRSQLTSEALTATWLSLGFVSAAESFIPSYVTALRDAASAEHAHVATALRSSAGTY